jgi:hypothetical protein
VISESGDPLFQIFSPKGERAIEIALKIIDLIFVEQDNA